MQATISSMWFAAALIGYMCLAVVAMLDKYILSKEKVAPIVFVFYSTIFLLPLALAAPFLSYTGLTATVAFVAVCAGGLFVASLGTMYLALQKTEVSHTGPFIGALTPLFILVFSQIFLGEVVGSNRLVGILLLSIGSLLIAYQKTPSHKSWAYHINPAVVAAFLFALFHVSAKFTYAHVGFTHGFVLIWSTMGCIGLVLGLASKTVHEHFFPKHPFIAFLKKHLVVHHNQAHEFLAIAFDKVLGALGVFLVQFAVSLGSVTAVNALAGVQYGLVILLVAVCTMVAPHIFKEKYERGELVMEFVAVLVICVGIALVV